MKEATETADVSGPANQTPGSDRELSITRIIDATPDKVYRAWTEPALLKRWFAPEPWTTPVVETDVRPGGSSLIVMRGPDGNEFPNRGVYLEVVKNERLVFTDAYTRAWEPSRKAFMTVTVTFEKEGSAMTRYVARVQHWSAADCHAHKEMGFHQGWGKSADQLAALAATI